MMFRKFILTTRVKRYHCRFMIYIMKPTESQQKRVAFNEQPFQKSDINLISTPRTTQHEHFTSRFAQIERVIGH